MIYKDPSDFQWWCANMSHLVYTPRLFLVMHAHTAFLCHASIGIGHVRMRKEQSKLYRMREGEMRYTCNWNKQMRGIIDGERRKNEGRMKRRKHVCTESCACVLS